MTPPLDLDDRGPARRKDVARLLSKGPMSAAQLASGLGITQPNVSRIMRAMAADVAVYRIRGVRTPRYALLRSLPLDVSARQAVYRVDAEGKVHPAGSIALLHGGRSLRIQESTGTHEHDGLPPAMDFASPSGFLGRQIAQGAATRLRVPARPQDWNDDHRALWLFLDGADLPGDLVFGDAALEQALRQRRGATPVAAARRLVAWHASIDRVATVAAGSSAGGEWPKFLAHVEDRGHLIVKFARARTRTGELLKLEHLALQALQGAGIEAARTSFVEDRGMAFLEVRRFDRIGDLGRAGMISAGALDDEHFGQRDHWSAFAERAVSARWLSATQALPIHVMEAYSELIGNTDRHFENISLLLDERQRVSSVAPAYDLLPMKYAPLGGGIEPPLVPITPRLGAVGGRLGAWRVAIEAALAFWESVRRGRFECDGHEWRIAREFKELAGFNLQAVKEFAEPLVSRTTKA